MGDKPKVVRMLEEYIPAPPQAATVVAQHPSIAKDLEYEKKIKTLVYIMSPLVAVPKPDGGVYTKYLIEDEAYRLQIQDWIMALTKEHVGVGKKEE